MNQEEQNKPVESTEETKAEVEATESSDSAATQTEPQEAAAVPADKAETAAETPRENVGDATARAVAEFGAASEDQPEPHRKTRIGLVVSDKMEKSIVVQVTRRVRHPLYKKYFYKSKKFMAHDEENSCGIGDKVRIVETRPLSARKRWTLDTIIERAK